MSSDQQAPAVDRPEPPYSGAERQLLEGWLDFHRATLLTKCEGLDDEQLKVRSVDPSSLSILGLVRHMTDVERYWFRCVVGAEPLPPQYSARYDEDGPFDDVDEADSTADRARLDAEVDLCRQVAAAHLDLDEIRHGWRGGAEVAVSVRWVYLHMIEEYARHNGHADFLRERIDGVTGV